jgi:2-keto-4-pentenoate hydratase/2-oxohepta-3-ene-1,7-dioic acid hydratase in catechol pathway
VRLCRFDAGARARHGIVEDGFVADRDHPSARHALEDVRLLSPVLPRTFLAIGFNYADHIAESGMEAPQFPVLFNKQVPAWSGPATMCTCRRSPACSTTRASWRS